MSIAQQGDTVKVHYTGTLDDGTVFDSSVGRDPIEFTIGEHTVIQGFEDAVVGLQVGEKKSVSVAPEDGYGERDERRVVVVERSYLPDDLNPHPGMVIQGTLPQGSVILHVTAVSDDQVTLDANHPLAGKQLNFDLEVKHIARP